MMRDHSLSTAVSRPFRMAAALLLAAAAAWRAPRLPPPLPHPSPLPPRAPPCRMASPAPSQPASIAFPRPLSPLERMQRQLSFSVQALPVVLSYLRLHTTFRLRERLLNQCLSDEECEVLWDEQHEKGAATISSAFNDLKGFYVKVGQIIASRQDLFPRQYTEKLSGLTDMLDPMPGSLARAVIAQELLHEGEEFDSVFAEFDDAPLGAASVAQVHRAVLTEAYGGAEVAVKVQRPNIEAKLLGDVATLKALSKNFRNMEAVPVDYYIVFSELEAQLADEFDFVNEAAAMERIGAALCTSPDGLPCVPPLVTPRPVAGLVSRRVLVMDYLRGEPLSRAVETMRRRGLAPDSAEARLFGRQLLRALTEAFGRTILETGFFHADPHPGNIFVLDDGRVGLIDFGQVKQISGRNRETLAKVMIALADRSSDTDPEQLAAISKLALELGVRLQEDAPDEGPAATAMWLFDGSVDKLPGGFDTGELSPNSPVSVLKSFPQDLVLVGRSTVLIKGIAARLGVKWSLANEWAPIARRVLSHSKRPPAGEAPRLRAIVQLLGAWLRAKTALALRKLPPPMLRLLARAAACLPERGGGGRKGGAPAS